MQWRESELWKRFASLASEAGCPKDQALNFSKAGWFPFKKQFQFAAACRQADRSDGPIEIGYGGARGGGKTDVLFAQIGLDDCQRQENLRALILRKGAKANLENFKARRMKIFGNIKHEFVPSKGLMNFPNGSRIIMGHFQNERDIDNYLGLEYDVIGIEEATMLTATKQRDISTCCRTSKKNWRPRMYSTTNPGGISHCVPFGEVLTPNGWIDIKEMKVGDSVYTVDPSGKMKETTVAQTHQSHYSGKMITVETRGLTMVCTPNHSVAKIYGKRKGMNTREGGKKFSLVPFENLPGQATILRSVDWVGNEVGAFTPDEFPMRRRFRHQPDTITGDQFMELMGWFLSEGHTDKSARCFGIAQKKEFGRNEIKRLLDQCGFVACWGKNGCTVNAPNWFGYLRQFGKSRDKFIPRELKGATGRQLRIMFNALVDGDGHWTGHRGGSGLYFTISKQLADDVCEVALKLGYNTYVTKSQQKDRVGPRYTIGFHKTKSGGTEILTGHHTYKVSTKTKRRSDIRNEDFDGMVYCIGIDDTHNFVIRQNGTVWISGNSHFKTKFILPFKAGRETTTRFIPSLVTDNPYVNPDYVRVLNELTGWKLRAWRDGDWDIAAGQFFNEFRWEKHVDPADKFTTAKAREWFIGYDYGYNHYTVFLLCFEDNDGNVVIWDEHAERKWIPERHAEAVKEMLGRHECHFMPRSSMRMERRPLEIRDIRRISAGPDVFSAQDDGRTIADDYAEHGINLELGHVNRINGWAEISKLLGDDKIAPRLFIHRRCKKLIDQLPQLVHDENRPEDVEKVDIDEDGNGGDDAADACRLALATKAFKAGTIKVVGL